MLSLNPTLPSVEEHFGEIRQIAYVVDDLNAAMLQWRGVGVSHFLVTRNASPMANARYRQQKIGKIVVDIAFAYLGDLQLELIEQKNSQASIYNEKKHMRPGLPHHYAVCPADFHTSYSKAIGQDFSTILNCGFEGLAQMAYIEANDNPDLILEVIEWNELTKPYFEQIERRWKNADPNSLEHEFDLRKLTPLVPTMKKLAWLALSKVIPTPSRPEKTSI